MSKVYAVRVGRVPGVYTSWADCQSQTHGFKRAVFKSFPTREEGEAFLVGIPSPARTGTGSGRAASVGGAQTTEAAEQVEQVRIYTDGSCPQNVGAAGRQGAAGWGMVIFQDKDDVDFYGPVVFDSSDPQFLGATVGTNNTGELSAIAMSLKWMLEVEESAAPCTIFYDSDYAANIAQALWRAKENLALAKTVQQLLRDVRQRRKVSFKHVKGHSGNPGNDRADKNADLGAQGQLRIWPRLCKRKREADSCVSPRRKVFRTLPASLPSTTNSAAQDLPRCADATVSAGTAAIESKANEPAPQAAQPIDATPTAVAVPNVAKSAPLQASKRIDPTPTAVAVPNAAKSAPLAKPDSADVSQDQLRQLVEMGFNRDVATVALSMKKANSIEEAVETLLSGSLGLSAAINRQSSDSEIMLID